MLFLFLDVFSLILNTFTLMAATFTCPAWSLTELQGDKRPRDWARNSGCGLEQERRASSGGSLNVWRDNGAHHGLKKQRVNKGTDFGQKVLYGSREPFDWLGLHKDYLWISGVRNSLKKYSLTWKKVLCQLSWIKKEFLAGLTQSFIY